MGGGFGAGYGSSGNYNNDCSEICAQTCNIKKENGICMKYGEEVKCFNDYVFIKNEECLKKNINNIILCSKLEGFFDANGDRCKK